MLPCSEGWTLGREGGIGATNQGAAKVSQGEAVSLQPPTYHLPGQKTLGSGCLSPRAAVTIGSYLSGYQMALFSTKL